MPSPAPIRIGCSGWNYKHWRGRFYPEDLPQKRWFQHYAATFNTVEINNSFYRLPKADTVARWRDQAPPGFCYAVKANRFLTQARKLRDCAEPLERMMTPLRELGPTLGPILYQLPPRFRVNLDRLEDFLSLTPADVTHVFEFRDPTWLTEEVLALLDAHGASFCVHDMPGSATPRWASGRATYIRFHGATGKYHGRYRKKALRGWSEWITEQAESGRPVWCYFNNDIDAHAIADALALKEMVTKRAG